MPELVLQQRQLPINPAKLRDIEKQLKFIPAQYRALYLGLMSSDNDAPTAEDEEAEEELTADVSQYSVE